MSNEKIDKKFQSIENRLSKLENTVFGEGNSFSSTKGIEKIIVEKIDEIKIQHLVVISLKLNGKQTKDEIKKTLQDWGKVFGDWFGGGNFTNRLLKTNIVKSVGKNEKGKDLFSLTQKGELLVGERIEKIKN